MPHPYQPKPNSVPARAVALLSEQPRRWSTQELAHALGVGQTSMHGRLDDALRAGLVRKTLANVGGRSITQWWLGDGTPADDEAPATDVEPGPFECALWNDGSLSLSCAGGQLVMPPEEADELAQYLARTWAPRERAGVADGGNGA